MMEFITSRVALMMCGAVLMSAVALPVCQMLDSEEDSSMEGIAEKDAMAIDALLGSGMDGIHLEGRDLLPSSSYRLTAEGHFLTITGEGGTYTAALAHEIGYLSLGYSDSADIRLS